MKVRCNHCAKILNVPDSMQGQAGKCPACGHLMKFRLLGATTKKATSPVMPVTAQLIEMDSHRQTEPTKTEPTHWTRTPIGLSVIGASGVALILLVGLFIYFNQNPVQPIVPTRRETLPKPSPPELSVQPMSPSQSDAVNTPPVSVPESLQFTTTVEDATYLPTAPLDRIKQATVLLINRTTAHFNSGFFVHPRGYIVTRLTALAPSITANSIDVVINAGQPNQEVFHAGMVRSDPERDLALLQIQALPEDRRLVWLPLGDPSTIVETLPTLVSGFPLAASMTAEARGGNGSTNMPVATIDAGRIDALVIKQGRTIEYLIRGTIEPESYGGPLCDTEGKVIGVISAQGYGKGWGHSCPIELLLHFLSQPLVELQVSTPGGKEFRAPRHFQAKVVCLLNPSAPLNVNLVLDAGGNTERNLQMIGSKNTFAVDALLFKQPEALDYYRVKIQFAQSILAGVTGPLEIRLDGQSLSMRQIQRIDFGPPAHITMVDHTQISGLLTLPPSLTLEVAGTKTEVPLAQATSLQIEAKPVPPVKYRVEIQRDHKPWAEITGEVSDTIETGAGRAESAYDLAGPITPPVLTEDLTTINLPASFSTMTIGGGGRFLIFYLPATHQIAVFDVNVARIIKLLPLKAERLFLAASREKLVVALPDLQMIQRYSLMDFSREASVAVTLEQPIIGLQMGPGGDGPLLVRTTEAERTESMQFFNLTTLDRMGSYPPGSRGGRFLRSSDDLDIDVSGNGLYILIREYPASEITTLFLGRDPSAWKIPRPPYESDLGGKLTLSYDGQEIYDSDGTVIDQQHQALARFQTGRLIPSLDGEYYLHVTRVDQSQPASQTAVETRYKINVYFKRQKDSLAAMTLPLDTNFVAGTHFLRTMVVPAANLIVVLPESNNQIQLIRLDFDQLLAKTGVDYLVFASKPPTHAIRGQRMQYPIRVKSLAPDITYFVDSGPPGMFVSAAGLVEWSVPGQFASNEFDVVLSAHTKSGKVAYQSFKLVISDAVPGSEP